MKNILLVIFLALAANAAKADTLDDIRQAIIEKINEYRANSGLSPLTRWVEGEACANLSAEKDSKIFNQTKVPHQSEESKGICYEGAAASGQNTLANYYLERAFYEGLNTLQESLDKGIEKMWDEKRTNGIHYKNMSNEKFKQVAVGIYVNPDKDSQNRDKYWVNMNFRD